MQVLDQTFVDAVHTLAPTACHGAVSAEALAQHVGCSATTARRRAFKLAEEGKLTAQRWRHIGHIGGSGVAGDHTRRVLAFYVPRKDWPAGVIGDYGRS